MKNKANRTVNIEMPAEWFKRKDNLELSWKNIVGLGLQAAEQTPGYLTRIHKLEADMSRIDGVVTSHSGDIIEIKKRLYRLE